MDPIRDQGRLSLLSADYLNAEAVALVAQEPDQLVGYAMGVNVVSGRGSLLYRSVTGKLACFLAGPTMVQLPAHGRFVAYVSPSRPELMEIRRTPPHTEIGVKTSKTTPISRCLARLSASALHRRRKPWRW